MVCRFHYGWSSLENMSIALIILLLENITVFVVVLVYILKQSLIYTCLNAWLQWYVRKVERKNSRFFFWLQNDHKYYFIFLFDCVFLTLLNAQVYLSFTGKCEFKYFLWIPNVIKHFIKHSLKFLSENIK